MPNAAAHQNQSVIFRLQDWPWWLTYVLLMLAVAYGMIAFRNWTMRTYDSDAAAQEWLDWKDKATEMATQKGPVKRKAPTSMEPPGLRLARDYFVACFAGGMTLASVLIGVFLLLARGAMKTTTMPMQDQIPKHLDPQ